MSEEQKQFNEALMEFNHKLRESIRISQNTVVRLKEIDLSKVRDVLAFAHTSKAINALI